MIRRLVAITGNALISLGVRLADAADPQPDLAETDSCATCRDRFVLSPAQLATLVGYAADGLPVDMVALEANFLGRIPGMR